MSKLIKNSDFIRNKLEKCIDLLKEKDENNSDLIDTYEVALNEDYLSVDLLKSLKTYWNKHNESKLYIHELLARTELYLPKLETVPRDPALEQRIQEIKAQLEESAYQKMVYNVDLNSPLRFDDYSVKGGKIVPEFKTLQGQIIAIINTFAVIIGSFVFGYKAVEYSLPEPDITKQMVAGFILAMIVAVADLYFLFKKLMSVDETFDKKPVDKTAKKVTTQTKKSKLDKKKD